MESKLAAPLPHYAKSPLVTLTHTHTHYPTQDQMHTEQFTYTSNPQLDGEESTTETLCHSYPQPRPVAVEDLSFEDRKILESVSVPWCHGFLPLLQVVGPSELTRASIDRSRTEPSPGAPWQDASVRSHI